MHIKLRSLTKTSKQEKTVQNYKNQERENYLETEEVLISLYLFASLCDLHVLRTNG